MIRFLRTSTIIHERATISILVNPKGKRHGTLEVKWRS